MIAFLNLIRWKNLLLIALMQIIFRYGFLKHQDLILALNHFQYFLLILSTLCIAAAGYIINDIEDQYTDFFNKPESVIIGKKITEKNAYNYYFVLNIIGVIAGFYLSRCIMRSNFAIIFIVISFLLYLYATSLKQSLLIGNILIAILTSLSVVIIGIFDLFPAIYDGNKIIISTLFLILLDYAIFAFLINLMREIIKDCEDILGDKNMDMNTLPIKIGIPKTAKIISIFSILPILILFYYININYFQSNLYYITTYCLIFILAPLIYFSIKSWSAKDKSDFKKLSFLLKVILFFGILSVLVLTANMKYNA